MGDMIVVIKVFPEDDRVDLESLSTEIEKILPEKVRLEKKEKEPLAFGLNSLLLYLIMPEDIELSMDQLEEKINSVPKVNHAEVISMHRVSF